uniref:Uncharacterized protein n=1 Tax=Micrurus lemniscatus lemniscatus TaxID=129467 RepID=A0A2D4H8Y2_MICLE
MCVCMFVYEKNRSPVTFDSMVVTPNGPYTDGCKSRATYANFEQQTWLLLIKRDSHTVNHNCEMYKKPWLVLEWGPEPIKLSKSFFFMILYSTYPVLDSLQDRAS